MQLIIILLCNETYSVSVMIGHLKTGVTDNGMLVVVGAETVLIFSPVNNTKWFWMRAWINIKNNL